MAKQSKDGEYLHCYIRADLMAELKKHCEKAERTRTNIVERALKEYLEKHKDSDE